MLCLPLKVKAIAEARLKTDKISVGILADLLRAGLLPRAYAPSKQTGEFKNILRQRISFVWVQKMVKNRIDDILDRHPEVLSDAPDVSDLFGSAGMQWLEQIVLPGEDNKLLASELELLNFLREKVSPSNSTVRELAKKDERAKLLQSIPGIGPFFFVLILYEIDDIRPIQGREKAVGLCWVLFPQHMPQVQGVSRQDYETGSKWLRWAAIEAAQTVVRSDSEFHAYSQRIRIRKGINTAKVATARRLLTIV